MIDKDTIQEILETSRIEEVVGEFVTLKKRGARYLGHCPFHNEKTPSFTVTPKLGIFKCFGCGKGGDSVNFLMEHEKFSYPEALKYLAKKYNIEIQEETKTPEQVESIKEEESLYHVTDFAAKYFAHNIFNTQQGKAIGLSYFKERGFRDDIIKKFNLGYAIDGWSDFTDHALRNGYKLEFLEKTGLTIVKTDKQFDRFKGRVMFPIQNIAGRVLGFGGRTLSSEKTVAKYVNSPESEIYHKSKVLYGINLAKAPIIAKDNCYLVEGYTDVISLHQAGIENVVASSGTSLTTDQIKLIKRYTKNVTILYDGDAAGIKAAFRGVDMILEEGMDVKIVLFPDGEDPDSFARSHSSTEVEEYITNNSKNFIFFKTSLLLKESQGDPLKMANLTREIVGSVALIPDRIVQLVYIKECATLLKIGEETLMNELNRIRRKNFDSKIKENQTAEPEKIVAPFILKTDKQGEVDFLSSDYQEKDIVRLLMHYGARTMEFEVLDDKEKKVYSFNVAKYIVDDLIRDDIRFTNSGYQKIIDLTALALQDGIIPDEKFFLNAVDKEVALTAATLLTSKYELNNWAKVKIRVHSEEESLNVAVSSSLLSFKLRVLERRFEENLKNMEHANADDQFQILVAQRHIQQKIELISTMLGRIVLR